MCKCHTPSGTCDAPLDEANWAAWRLGGFKEATYLYSLFHCVALAQPAGDGEYELLVVQGEPAHLLVLPPPLSQQLPQQPLALPRSFLSSGLIIKIKLNDFNQVT